MRIQPVAGPQAVQQAPSNEAARTAKAVAAFNRASEPQTPTPSAHSAQLNQNAISPEDVGAIRKLGGQENSIDEAATAAADPVAPDAASSPSKPAEDPALSRQFAQLARQEKAIRARAQQQEQAIKAREQALATREAEFTAKQPDLSKYIPRDQIKAEVLDLIDRGEVSYDEITQRVLNQPNRDPRMEATLSKMEAKIRELEAKNEEIRKNGVEQQTQAYQAAVKQIRVDVDNLIKSDPSFEAVRATRSAKDVVELIEATYHKDGVLLSVEEAAQQVEDYLTEEAMKLTNIEKIKRKLQQNAQQATGNSVQKQTPQQSSKSGQQQPTMKTLTNNTASTRQLSAKERAILAFKGELKN